jgi:hypothetical protein
MKKYLLRFMVVLMAGAMLVPASGCGKNKQGVEMNDASGGGNETVADGKEPVGDGQGTSRDGTNHLNENRGSALDASGGGKTEVGEEINLLEVFRLLEKREDELGLSGRYGTVSDVNIGSVYPEIVGEWISSDGSLSYSFSAEGVMESRHDLYGIKTETQFTMFNVDGTDVIGYDAISISLSDQEGDDRTGTEIDYYTFDIVNDTLYMVDVESIDEAYNSYVSTLQILYRTDGKRVPAVKNPVKPESLYGRWEAEGVDVVIGEAGFTLNGGTCGFSFDDRGMLLLDRDGVTSAYSYSLAHQKNYATADRSRPTDQKYLLTLYYEGLSEEDVPNLADCLVNWKNEYDWESWYYTLSLSRSDENP